MKRRGFKLMLAAALLTIGFGFSARAHALTINGAFQGDELVWQINTGPDLQLANYYLSRDLELDWTCDPGLLNPRQTDQDLAFSEGTFNTARDSVTLTVYHAYPGYYDAISTYVTNTGTEPIIMPRPVLNWMGNSGEIVDSKIYLLLSDGQVLLYPYPYTGPVPDNALAEFSWRNNTGNELEPYGEFQENFCFHILAQNDPPQSEELTGLTPGYWKNWDKHYTEAQFSTLLAGTIAENTGAADKIFKKYSARPGMELTILKAHLLATQLTLNLTVRPNLPNPDGACLVSEGALEWNGTMITVGEAVQKVLDILNNPGAYTRNGILKVKDLLDYINNLE